MAVSRIATFMQSNFGFFRNIVGGIPWVRVLKGSGVQDSWSIVKHHFLQAQDQCIPTSKKANKGGRRPAWKSRELLEKLKQRRKFTAD